jgi:hypothetical protein
MCQIHVYDILDRYDTGKYHVLLMSVRCLESYATGWDFSLHGYISSLALCIICLFTQLETIGFLPKGKREQLKDLKGRDDNILLQLLTFIMINNPAFY